MGAAVSADWASGLVPAFRAGERDRGAAGLDASIVLRPVEIRARWRWILDRTPLGETNTGPGDLELGTIVTVARPGPFEIGLGWDVKLPNAADEGEIGTDETDVGFGASGRWTHGPLRAQLAIGLDVLGNPLRFANQDDVPVVGAALEWRHGALAILGRSDLAFPTPRNPARAEGDVAVRLGKRWFVLVHGGAGFVPASADWHLGLTVGWAAPLSVTAEGV